MKKTTLEKWTTKAAATLEKRIDRAESKRGPLEQIRYCNDAELGCLYVNDAGTVLYRIPGQQIPADASPALAPMPGLADLFRRVRDDARQQLAAEVKQGTTGDGKAAVALYGEDGARLAIIDAKLYKEAPAGAAAYVSGVLLPVLFTDEDGEPLAIVCPKKAEKFTPAEEDAPKPAKKSRLVSIQPQTEPEEKPEAQPAQEVTEEPEAEMPAEAPEAAAEAAEAPQAEEVPAEAEEKPAAASYTINEERGGVEVSFPGKPAEAVRDQLKASGFRWHNVRRVWYAKATPDRLALVQSLAGSAAPVQMAQKAEPQRQDLTAEDLEAITAKYAEMVTADGEGIYSGYTGANGRGLYGQDLKKAILAELKKNGFSATARSGRGGYTDSFTFTVKVPEAFVISEADYIRAETEGRTTVRSVYWYTTPAGQSIHRDALPYDYEERQPILEETARRIYRDSVANQSGENVAEVFKRAVKTIVTSFNSDHSDSMTDYFDRGIYDWYRWAAV